MTTTRQRATGTMWGEMMSDAQELRERIAGRRVVASVSGGKDSAALSLWLKEQEIDHDRVFIDTGWEHRDTYAYIRGELARVIGSITEIKGPRGFADLVRHKGMFPSRVIRFCTQELKVYPMQRWIRARVDEGADLVNAVGIRRGESEARSRMTEWEWADGFDCEVWRPLVEWSERDVIEIHQRHGLRPNPLYLRGASRVGCWPCIFSRKSEIARMAEIDPDRVSEIRDLEREMDEIATRKAAARGEELINARTLFSRSHVPAGKDRSFPIDDAVRWARGSGQLDLLGSAGFGDGCMRWGLCETVPPESGRDD